MKKLKMTVLASIGIASLISVALPVIAQAGGTGDEASGSAEPKATCPLSGAACCGAAAACPTAQTVKGTPVAYKVTGLACSACEQKLTAALSKIEGVREASACAKSQQAKLTIDSAKVKRANLLAAIEGAGFKVDGEILDVKVDGLKCESCSGKVSKALAALKGIKDQQVCHVSQHVVVTFDPKKLSGEQVMAAIDQTGFKVVR